MALYDEMVDMAIKGAHAAKRGVKTANSSAGRMSRSGSAWRLLESTPSVAPKVKASPSTAKATAKAVTKTAPKIKKPRKAPGPIRRQIGSINKMPLGVGASIGIGAALGVGSGIRSTFHDMNESAGNPVGFATNIGVRTAFSGNPVNSRTGQGGASGDMVWKTRH